MWPFLIPAIDGRERRWLAAVIVLQMLAITLPYLWAWANTPPGYQYQGLLLGAEDPNVHLAWARQAYEGHFFVRDLFTHETLTSGERPLFNNLLTFTIGVLSRLTQVPMILVYHGLRLIFAALTLFFFYTLCACLTDNCRIRLLALLLAAFSGGIGWMGLIFGWPKPYGAIDLPDTRFMMPEAFTFTSVFTYPMFAASMALLSLIYLLLLHAQRKDDWRPAGGAGIAGLILGNIHTYDALPLGVVLSAWGFYCWTKTRRRMDWLAPLIVIASMALPVMYQIFVFLNSSEFRLKAITRTPPPALWDILLSYGLPVPLAIWGAWVLRDEHKSRLTMLWLLVSLSMIYLPLSFGRKMIEGAHLPLCFLAAAGLATLTSPIPNRVVRRTVIVTVLALCCYSSVYFVRWCLLNAQENNYSRVAKYSMIPLYLTRSDIAALNYLGMQPKESSKNRFVVLASPMLSNYVPRYTGNVVFGGHPAETLHYFDIKTNTGKFVEVKRFFGQRGQMTASEARMWLQKNRIGIVIMGKYESHFGASLPVPMKVIKEFPGVEGLPGTIIFDATSAYPKQVR
jgi:hypothetical protein